MRKVSETVCKAFLAGQSRTVSNTWTDGVNLYLYGNKIASKINNAIRIYDGGHTTATTKERLNALLQVMNSSNEYEMIADCVYQRNYQWHIQFNNNSNGKFINGTIVGVVK